VAERQNIDKGSHSEIELPKSFYLHRSQFQKHLMMILVRAAYGWPLDIGDPEVLERLLALNTELGRTLL